MRLSEPRVTPIEESEVDGEAKELLERTRGADGTPRIFRTLVRHPKLLKRWLVFGNHILAKSTPEAHALYCNGPKRQPQAPKKRPTASSSAPDSPG